MTSSDEERLVLVDEHDQAVGTGSKLSVHQEGLLHRAFSVFIFNGQGQLMLQQRALGKYHSGGLWTNTCCGHPRPGEAVMEAAHRRLQEEMGFDCPLQEVSQLTYRAQVSSTLIEHEFDHVFVGQFDGEVRPDPDEARDWEWIGIEALNHQIKHTPALFTVWFKAILEQPEARLETLKAHALGECPLKVHKAVPMTSGLKKAIAYQKAILPHVSRTFALTIPQLPAPLCHVVGHAYLLCRMADTIEDEPTLSVELKHRYEQAFVEAIAGRMDAQVFCDELRPLLSTQTLAAERELMDQLPSVLEVNRSLTPAQRVIILDCLKVMSRGMREYQSTVSLNGLPSRHELDRYCYCVAGVVGEMLTDLFIDFAPELASQRPTLLRLSVSFGLGLQLTNILKDQWEDRLQGVCWLPRDLFAEHGVQLNALQPGQTPPGFEQGLNTLLGTAHAHLRQGLEYACLMPQKHTGIRRFIVWSTGLAVLTLRHVHARPGFRSGNEVKATHAELLTVMHLTRLCQRSPKGLRVLFKTAARSLPLTPLGPEWQPESEADIWPKPSIPFLAEITWTHEQDFDASDKPVATL